MKLFLSILGALFLGAPNCLAFADSPQALLLNLVKESENLQDSLFLGKEFNVTLLRTDKTNATEKKQYRVKIYDKRTWVLTKKTEKGTLVIGQNLRYFFVILKKTENRFELLTIDPFASKSHFENLLFNEYCIINPMISIGGLKITDFFSTKNEYSNTNISGTDFTQISFTYFDNKIKEKNYGPVDSKIIYNNLSKKFSYIENMYNNYKPELTGKYSRNFVLNENNEIASAKITNEMLLRRNDTVYEKEEYFFSDFSSCTKSNDNYLEFYGLPNPSAKDYPYPPWPLSNWLYLSGCLLIIFGGGLYSKYRLVSKRTSNA
jgi:hypothetical protein